MESARTKLSNVFEGWTKWQIATAVGAPIALGLAGLWFYNRSKRKTANKTNDRLTTDEVSKTSTSSASSTQDAEKPNMPKTPLEQAVAVKAKGNKYFKGGNYDKAIECYSEAILVCPDNKTEELSTFYQNRAAAYEQLRNNTKVIEDCTKALEYNIKYLKALSRRQKACEAIGNLTQSLEDITAVCILEGFQNQQSLVIADRVLKDLGKKRAKDAFKNRKPSLPSTLTIKHYFRDFPSDPIIHLSSDELSKPETNKHTEDNSANMVKNETDINTDINIIDKQNNEDNDNEQDTEGAENHNDEISNEQDENRKIPVSDSNDNSVSVAEEEIKATNQMPESPLLNGDVTQSTAEKSPFMKARNDLLDEKYADIIDLCTDELTIEDSKHLSHARLLRATFYILSGLELEAMNDLKILLSLDNITKPIRVNALIKRGGLFMRQEKQTESLGDFATAVRIDPNNSDVYHQRGQQNLLLERLDDAQSDFDKSISLNPEFAISHVQRCYAVHKSAMMLQSPLQMQKSLKAFQDTIKKFPFCSDACVLYGQALCDNGQFAEAETQFKLALNLEPENSNIMVHCGLLQLQWKQNVDEAISLINKAIDIDDKCEYAFEVLGTIEVQKANMDRAVELFNKAIELCKSESEMVHLFSLLAAANSQMKVARNLGINLPGSEIIPPS